MSLAATASRNARCFIALRLLMHARYYYPVFMILFLDFGLTVAQFSWLNAVWAVAIVTLEVPSGALADIVGRKALVVAAVVLMILEMLVLCVVPVGSSLVLGAFILNRILSGASEAAASGADEAVAYDALRLAGQEDRWPKVLEKLGYATATASFLAMSLGSAVFDPGVWNTVAGWLGSSAEFSKEDTVKWPLYLTLANAVVALGFALALRAPDDRPPRPDGAGAAWRASKEAFRGALRTGKWILQRREVWWIMLGGLMLDHVARFAVTVASEFLRTTGWEEALLGPLMAAMALIGLPLARLARFLIERRSPTFNAGLLTVWTLAALSGMAFVNALAAPWLPRQAVALLLIYGLFSVMILVQPLLSAYLNKLAPPERRATVLSFKGLALNVAYGGFGLLYARLFTTATQPAMAEGEAFLESLWVLPVYFALAVGAVLALAAFKGPGSFMAKPEPPEGVTDESSPPKTP
ncbi:MAG: MFS transporter [Opitutales bacterium]